VTNPNLKLTEVVEDASHLISLPEIYLKVQKVMDDPDHERQELLDLISYDTALSALLLRIVNSSYYAFPSQINRISTAVGIIGEKELANIVLATSMVNSTSKFNEIGINIDEFWLHSLQCGVGARMIGKVVGCNDANNLFLCGVLHDVGILALYQNRPELTTEINTVIESGGLSRYQVEYDRLGFDHSDVGEILLTQWKLSRLLTEVVGAHHQTDKASDYLHEAKIVALANLLGMNGHDFDVIPEEDPDGRILLLSESLGIDPATLPNLCESMQLQAHEILTLIVLS
jgi:HD-like signal output (HDOD) protein